jgi:hypothetical protein
MGTNG